MSLPLMASATVTGKAPEEAAVMEEPATTAHAQAVAVEAATVAWAAADLLMGATTAVVAGQCMALQVPRMTLDLEAAEARTIAIGNLTLDTVAEARSA